MSDADNLATAQRLYAAAGRGDWDAAEAELHDELVIHEAESLPYHGQYRGKRALRDLSAKVWGYWPGADIVRHGMAVGDGRVVVFFTLSFDGPDGRQSCEIVEVNEFRDGQIAVIKPFYWDAGAMARAAAALGRSA
jgi:ketosteroid isomerase-like protein